MASSSNSVGQVSSPFRWLAENARFFAMCVQSFSTKSSELEAYFDDIERYREICDRYGSVPFARANILEIGFGARPIRLIAMCSLGYSARGIDLDRPTLRPFALATYRDILARNGARRMLKSLVRGVLFDWHERSELVRALRRRKASLKIDEARFLIGNAASYQFPTASIDFVYSEDVFEHIPTPDLETICLNLARAMSPGGLLVISPCVFTGICGGHLTEWYPTMVQKKMRRKSEPWEHLRKRRFNADCYLNEMDLTGYRDLFTKHFEVMEIINESPGLGDQYLTDEIRRELPRLSAAELCSDKWTFVLKKRDPK